MLLGKRHPETLSSMYVLAYALRSQGKLDEAEEMNRQTLALRQQVLGAEHVDTFASMHGLASTLTEQGKYREAEELNRHTLALTTKVPTGLGASRNIKLRGQSSDGTTMLEQGRRGRKDGLSNASAEEKGAGHRASEHIRSQAQSRVGTEAPAQVQ